MVTKSWSLLDEDSPVNRYDPCEKITVPTTPTMTVNHPSLVDHPSLVPIMICRILCLLSGASGAVFNRSSFTSIMTPTF